MASETTFDHRKVVFSWGKVRKTRFSQNPLNFRFWSLRIWFYIYFFARKPKKLPLEIFFSRCMFRAHVSGGCIIRTTKKGVEKSKSDRMKEEDEARRYKRAIGRTRDHITDPRRTESRREKGHRAHCSPWCKKRGGFWRGNFKKWETLRSSFHKLRTSLFHCRVQNRGPESARDLFSLTQDLPFSL